MLPGTSNQGLSSTQIFPSAYLTITDSKLATVISKWAFQTQVPAIIPKTGKKYGIRKPSAQILAPLVTNDVTWENSFHFSSLAFSF